MTTQHSTKPKPRKRTLQKEALRRLSPAELRLAAGGWACGQGKHIPEARIVA
jgi:hypothetical protein